MWDPFSGADAEDIIPLFHWSRIPQAFVCYVYTWYLYRGELTLQHTGFFFFLLFSVWLWSKCKKRVNTLNSDVFPTVYHCFLFCYNMDLHAVYCLLVFTSTGVVTCFWRIHDVTCHVSDVQCNASDENHRPAALPGGSWNWVDRWFLVGWPIKTS